MAKPQDIVEVAKYIETGKCEVGENLLTDEMVQSKVEDKVHVRSSEEARMRFHQELNKKYSKKEKRSW